MRTKDLGKIGLGDKEAEIYVAILSGGPLTLSRVASLTKINRTTLYPYIHSLLEAEYITQTIRGKRTLYVAENPIKLLRQLKKREHSLELLMPGLQEIYARTSHQPKITTYEGVEGIAKMFREAGEMANYVKTFFSPSKYLSILSMEEGNYFLEQTKKNGVRAKGLCSDSEEGRQFMKTYKDINMNMRLMPHGISFPVEFMIYNQRVLIVSFEHRFAVLVESTDIKEFLEKMFDHFWGVAK